MSSDAPPVDFGEIPGLTVDSPEKEGEFKCPLCSEYEADSVESVQGHISSLQDEKHGGYLGFNFDSEIKDTGEENRNR